MITGEEAARRHDYEPGPERLKFLSDGVLAVALTLLVLELRVPTGSHDPNSASALGQELRADDGLGLVLHYLVAFYVIAYFWMVHQRTVDRLARHHDGVAWLNFAFLFTMTAIPFSSHLLGAYGHNPLAIDVFDANILLASVATQAMVTVGCRGEVLPRQDPLLGQVATLRTAGTVGVMVASGALAWVNTTAATLVWVLLLAVHWGARRWTHRPARQRAAAN